MFKKGDAIKLKVPQEDFQVYYTNDKSHKINFKKGPGRLAKWFIEQHGNRPGIVIKEVKCNGLDAYKCLFGTEKISLYYWEIEII